MSYNLEQEYKAVSLLFPAAITSTTSSTTVRDVEVYDDDAMAIVEYGAIGVNGGVTVTITGSLVATPTTYDQTLKTFVAQTSSYQIAADKISLTGIKNIKATATILGSTSVAVSVTALVKAVSASADLNTSTGAEG